MYLKVCVSHYLVQADIIVYVIGNCLGRYLDGTKMIVVVARNVLSISLCCCISVVQRIW